jgi:hypothetical protein
MASTRLNRTFGTADNYKKQTFSAWVKRSGLGGTKRMIGSYDGSSTYSTEINFDSDQLRIEFGGGSHNVVKTNALYRDTNAWYHIVVAIDTTQATASDRIKFYVNGEQITSFATANYPAQNSNSQLTSANSNNNVGSSWGGSDPYDGSMSHVHFTDGYTYQASDFGQYDANGVWTIKTSPSVTYGTNGFFILKDGNSVTDQSGNGNNFTVAGGTLTNTEDNPSNVFATWNALMLPSSMQYQNGNTSIRPQANSIDFQAASTLAFSSGKYYVEFKYLENDKHQLYGIATTEGASEDLRNLYYLGQQSHGVGYYANNGVVIEGGTNTSYGSAWSNNDIVMMAVDADNNKIYFGRNGIWENSANPNAGTGGYTYNSTNLAGYKYIVASNGTVGYDNTDANFGNGYFGTTAVASAGTNASGNGIFEYDVPTGFTALSTKGLNL